MAFRWVFISTYSFSVYRVLSHWVRDMGSKRCRSIFLPAQGGLTEILDYFTINYIVIIEYYSITLLYISINNIIFYYCKLYV